MCTNKRPLKAKIPKDKTKTWRLPKQLRERQKQGLETPIMVKCGKCYECKKEKGRNWTYKIWLEALQHEEKCFLTLTYADNPKTLIKKDLQDFIKRIRKNEKWKEVKYFGAGEYGEKRGRPHYHLIILGWQPKDLKISYGEKSKKGNQIYKSENVKNTWGKGRITVQNFAYKEVGYLTLYLGVNEKINTEINEKAIKWKETEVEKIKKKLKIQGKILKEQPKTILKLYKKRYNKILELYNNSIVREKEFNVWSKGIGWENFIKKEYYKNNLIIDNKFFEIPKEFIRKVFENKRKLKEEIIKEIYKIQKERIEKAEEQWEMLTTTSIEKQEREAKEREIKDFNNKKLFKIHESDF